MVCRPEPTHTVCYSAAAAAAAVILLLTVPPILGSPSQPIIKRSFTNPSQKEPSDDTEFDLPTHSYIHAPFPEFPKGLCEDDSDVLCAFPFKEDIHDDADSSAADAEHHQRRFGPLPDRDAFPLFYQAKGLVFCVSAGDALHIPFNWWHWLFTDQDTIAVNVWSEDPVSSHSPELDIKDHTRPELLKNIASTWPSTEFAHMDGVDASSVFNMLDIEDSSVCLTERSLRGCSRQEWLYPEDVFLQNVGTRSFESTSEMDGFYDQWLANETKQMVDSDASHLTCQLMCLIKDEALTDMQQQWFPGIRQPVVVEGSLECDEEDHCTLVRGVQVDGDPDLKSDADPNQNGQQGSVDGTKRYSGEPDAVFEQGIENNLWINRGRLHTGLHYDNYYNVLHVVSGRKIVLLFPPSQSHLLYPNEMPSAAAASEGAETEP